ARPNTSARCSRYSRTAGELLPQRRELLVAGQRAAALGGLLRRRGRRRGGRAATRGVVLLATLDTGRGVGRGSGVGGSSLGHLAHVLLVASVRLGVLLLPLLALGLVPFLPLLGVGVEALGVDVVALLVVLGGHAVLRRVEVGVRREALVRLLQRQRDATTLEVDVDDLDHDLGADLHDLLRDLHVALGQLGDVHQALDALL